MSRFLKDSILSRGMLSRMRSVHYKADHAKSNLKSEALV